MLAGIRARVVDDDSAQTEMYAFGLGRLGALVSCAASVAKALDVVASAPVDVIVGDIGLPGRDGYELARAACGRRRRPDGRGDRIG